MSWEAVIGLEVHAQLATKSKIFSGAATAYGAIPNSQACAIDLGLPGTLPVLNEEAVKMAVKFGLAVGATIAKKSVFDRKNYFYPDLPKGYQISQFSLPIVVNGKINIALEDGTTKTIQITRAHLEEDAGKSVHEEFPGKTGIDLNRAGTPLLEIVSEPDLRSAKEAVAYLKKLHNLVCYLEICDGNMQEGSFRCDANISVRKKGTDKYGTRAEIKNINSFKFVEKAITYEITRQINLLESGKLVLQETRLYNSHTNTTHAMRSKEEANDYRYFPDPDLLPVIIDHSFIQSIRATLPELPDAKKDKFMREYNLSAYDAGVLTSNKDLADFYEHAVKASQYNPKLTANWVMGEFLAALNQDNLELKNSPISANALGKLISKIADNTISGKIAKTVFEAMWLGEGDAEIIIEKRGLRQVTDSTAIEKIVDSVITANPSQVAAYKSGKDKLFGFFVGQIMQQSKGKANPEQVNKILKDKL
jgi:aspartyl-tRNA(Asn)/glutamyl-tRNA(Gln) amidotransferase subunit B